jgi:hypothetical protein
MSGNCPVCNLEIVNNQCPKCRREYHSIQQQNNFKSLNYDIETVSTESGDANPILLCSNDDANSINQTGIQREKEKDYLKKHFPNADIDTQVYYPTE